MRNIPLEKSLIKYNENHLTVAKRNRLVRIGIQKELSQDVPPLYADYFELKATKILGAQEKLLPTPFNYL